MCSLRPSMARVRREPKDGKASALSSVRWACSLAMWDHVASPLQWEWRARGPRDLTQEGSW